MMNTFRIIISLTAIVAGMTTILSFVARQRQRADAIRIAMLNDLVLRLKATNDRLRMAVASNQSQPSPANAAAGARAGGSPDPGTKGNQT